MRDTKVSYKVNLLCPKSHRKSQNFLFNILEQREFLLHSRLFLHTSKHELATLFSRVVYQKILRNCNAIEIRMSGIVEFAVNIYFNIFSCTVYRKIVQLYDMTTKHMGNKVTYGTLNSRLFQLTTHTLSL